MQDLDRLVGLINEVLIEKVWDGVKTLINKPRTYQDPHKSDEEIIEDVEAWLYNVTGQKIFLVLDREEGNRYSGSFSTNPLVIHVFCPESRKKDRDELKRSDVGPGDVRGIMIAVIHELSHVFRFLAKKQDWPPKDYIDSDRCVDYMLQHWERAPYVASLTVSLWKSPYSLDDLEKLEPIEDPNMFAKRYGEKLDSNEDLLLLAYMLVHTSPKDKRRIKLLSSLKKSSTRFQRLVGWPRATLVEGWVQ